MRAYLSSIDSPSETSFPTTPSMVLTLPSPKSKSTAVSGLGSYDFPKENRTGETLTKPKSEARVPPEESSLSASKVSYNKEQCLGFKKESDGCDMEKNILDTKCSGSSQKFFPSDIYFTGPQTRSRKRKLEKMSEGDVTIVKHMFKGRNTRSKRFDTIVIDD